ncbi:MAG: hypothetical protein ACKV2T_16400 [Kofleriaceae bacterium]
MSDHQTSEELRRNDTVGGDPMFASTDVNESGGSDAAGSSDLIGPSLGDPGRGIDFSTLALDQLERDASALPDDPTTALAQLDKIAGEKLAFLDAPPELGPKEQEGSSGSGGAGLVPPQPKPKVGGPGPSVCTVASSRLGMEAQIRTAGAAEQAQLDTALEKQLGDLDTRMASELAKVDGAVGSETSKTGDATATGEATLSADITKQDAANQKVIGSQHATHVADVEKQTAALAKVSSDEQGWHRATKEDILAEITPHMNARVASTFETGTKQAAAAKQLALVRELSARGPQQAEQKAYAKTVATTASANIENYSMNASTQLRRENDQLLKAQDTRTDAATTAIAGEETAQGTRIQTQSEISSSEMQMHAQMAQIRMQTERAVFTTKAGGAGATATGAMSVERQAAKQRGDELKVEAANKLRATHARDKAAIDTKVQDMLTRLATTKDADLSKAGGRLCRDLAALDRTDGAATKAMKADVNDVQKTLAKDNTKRIAAIKVEGAKARAAIQAFVAEARKKILAANKGTDRDIASAGKRGREAIKSVGEDASKELVKFSETRQSQDVEAAEKDLERFDGLADKANLDMNAMALGVSATIDEKWAADARQSASKNLTGFFPEDAAAALNTLVGLPAHLQSDAIAQLSDVEFYNLTVSVGDRDNEAMKDLVKNVKDPVRRLELWGSYHKSHAMNDAKDDGAGTSSEEQRRHAARVKAAKGTAGEVDDELAFLKQRQATTGQQITHADIDKLMERKDTEHALEMKHNLSFTNDRARRKDGSHVHWEKDQLEQIGVVMDQMPTDHVAGNAGLTEIHRQENVLWQNDPKKPIGGLATGTKVLIPDMTVSTANIAERRQLGGAHGANMSRLQWTMTHELGHNVGDGLDAQYKKYEKIMGWEGHDNDTGALTDAEKKHLEATRASANDARNTVDKGRKTYSIDPNSDGYFSRKQGSLPKKGEAVPGDDGYADPWSYASTRFHEQFAEHYTRAVQVPEKVYADMMVTPQVNATMARVRVGTATNAADRAKAEEDLAIALQAQSVRQQSYDLMRNEVFGTDKEQTAAEARLTARGIKDLTVFRQKAAKASTPDQIRNIEATIR